MQIASPAFGHEDTIPEQHTCEGNDLSPVLEFTDVPEDAESLALIVDDPDAPSGTFVHWLLWNLPPNTVQLPEGMPGTPENPENISCRQGMNDFQQVGYRGPCPPDGTHRYRFTLYALDQLLDLEPEGGRDDLEEAMEGHVLEETTLIGSFGPS